MMSATTETPTPTATPTATDGHILTNVELTTQHAIADGLSQPKALDIESPIAAEIPPPATDTRLADVSWEAVDQQLQLYNLQSEEVGAEGNCQYHVLAHVLQKQGIDKSHEAIRRDVVVELAAYEGRYKDFVAAADGLDRRQSYEAMVEKTKQDGEWGDHLTLQAACNLYGLSLMMFRPDAPHTVEFQPHPSAVKVSLHANIAYLPEWHYRATTALNTDLDVGTPSDRVPFEVFAKSWLGGEQARVLWEADEAEGQQMSATTSALLCFLKYFHNQLRKQSLTGPNALHDVTHLFGAFLLGKDAYFRKRVQDRIDDKCKEHEEKGKDSTRMRAEYNKFRDKLFDFKKLRATDNVLEAWQAITYKFLNPLEPDVYKKQEQLQCDDHNTLRDIIQRMLDTLGNVDFDHNIGDHLGVLYEHFTNTYMRTSKDFGQYFTPHKLVRAIVSLLPKEMQLPDDASVYDPSMGTGCFLTSFANEMHQTQPHKKVHLHGREIQKLTYSLARMALTLCCKDAPATTQCTNTLIATDWDVTHDVVLSNPPFALKNKYAPRKKGVISFDEDESTRMLDYCKAFFNGTKHVEDKYANVDNPQNKPAKLLCVEDGEKEFYAQYAFHCAQDATLGMFVTHCVKKTKVGGYGAIVVPVGTRLCSGTERGAMALRKWMVDEADVFQIMEVPKGVFETAGVSTVVLYYRRGRPTKHTRFLRINVECTRAEELFTVSRTELDEHEWQFEAGVYREEEENDVHYGVPMVALGEVCDISTGTYVKKNEQASGPYPVYGGGNKSTTRTSNIFNREECLLVNKDGVSENCVHFVNGKFFLNHHGWTVQANEKTTLEYLTYVLSYLQGGIYELAHGAAQKGINQEQFLNFKIPLPPLHIQHQIVDDITPLDTLRTNLHAAIDIHKHRQKMYLRSMLRLNAGSCGKVALGEVCTFQNGKNLTKAEFIDGDVPVIGGGKKPTGMHNESNRDADTILVSSSGSYAGFVNRYRTPIWASDCFSVHSKDTPTLNEQFLYMLLKKEQERLYAIRPATAGQPHFYAKQFDAFKIPLPPLHLQTKWATDLQNFQTSIDDCTQVLASLDQERNDILQSYLTAPPSPVPSAPTVAAASAPNTPTVPAPNTPTVPAPNTLASPSAPPVAAVSVSEPQGSAGAVTLNDKKAVDYLTKHHLTHLVDWNARTIQGVPFEALKDVTDFRKGTGRAFRQKLKEVETKKVKKVVELLGQCA